ncbi:unnamed protein product, partial [Allacma fusca]
MSWDNPATDMPTQVKLLLKSVMLSEMS